MNIKNFRISKKISQEEAAQELCVSKDVYVSWEARKRIPRQDNMQKIIEWSGGEVTANDFYERFEES